MSMHSTTEQLTDPRQRGVCAEADFADPKYGDQSPSRTGPIWRQFQCNGALPAAKVYGRNPREIAPASRGQTSQTVDNLCRCDQLGWPRLHQSHRHGCVPG